METIERESILFNLGHLVATVNARDSVVPGDLASAIERHVTGDWGDLCEADKQANDRALCEGARLLSAYTDSKGLKFWIITEWDRSVTTILLPSDD